MYLLIVFLLGLAATALAKCATPLPSDELRALHAFHAAKSNSSINSRAEKPQIITINTYCHIISTGQSAGQGNLADQTIQNQV